MDDMGFGVLQIVTKKHHSNTMEKRRAHDSTWQHSITFGPRINVHNGLYRGNMP